VPALPQREVVLQKMQEEFKDKAAELQAIQADAKTKIEKLKRDGQLMGQDEVEKLRIEIGQLDSKYKIKAQALEQASARREAEEKQKLFKVIQDAVKKVAEKEGYDIVLDTSSMQYGKPEHNLSEKVIKAIK
ncbi:chaperone protein skp, partial [Vibrio cholerae NCTC 8457]